MKADVAIVGGGAIGAAAAYCLRSHPKASSVAPIERDSTFKHAATPHASGGVRRLFSLPENIALPNFSIPFFERFDEDMAVDGTPAATISASSTSTVAGSAMCTRRTYA